MYSLSGSTVTLITRLNGTTTTLSFGQTNSRFGFSVSVYNGYMVVGAYGYSKLKKTIVRLYIYM